MSSRTLSAVLLLVQALFACGSTATAQQEEKPLLQPFYIWARTGQQHVSLDGEWDLGYRDTPIASLQDLADEPKWIHAQVPGSVQVSLFRAGELPNPYVRMNAKKYDWVLGKTWYYRKSFTVPDTVKNQYVFLCFDGIDYYARIWLNGLELGRHESLQGGSMDNREDHPIERCPQALSVTSQECVCACALVTCTKEGASCRRRPSGFFEYTQARIGHTGG